MHFNEHDPLQEQVAFVISEMHAASADDISMQLMELKGIATEEGVAELTLEVKNELEKMYENRQVEMIAGNDTRYLLKHSA